MYVSEPGCINKLNIEQLKRKIRREELLQRREQQRLEQEEENLDNTMRELWGDAVINPDMLTMRRSNSVHLSESELSIEDVKENQVFEGPLIRVGNISIGVGALQHKEDIRKMYFEQENVEKRSKRMYMKSKKRIRRKIVVSENLQDYRNKLETILEVNETEEVQNQLSANRRNQNNN